MAHEKVERRSIGNKEWSKLVFDKLHSFIYEERFAIDDWMVREGVYTPDGYIWDDECYHPIKHQEMWGGPDTTAVFKCRFKLPESLQGKKVYFKMIAACEVMVQLDGKYIGGIDPNRDRFLLFESGNSGQEYELVMEAYTRSKPDDDRSLSVKRLKGCSHHFLIPELAVINEKILDVCYDLQALYDATYADLMPDAAKEYLEHKVAQVMKRLPHYDAPYEDYMGAIDEVKRYIAEEVLKDEHVIAKNGRLACVAYSHLDIAYHWKVAQTVQKNARTVLIQLALMDQYEDFTYAHTQTWTYEMLEKYYPELFERVKEKVKNGQWEIMGGLYVEPDCNLISAESYVRQIVYGKQYFIDKFGIEVDNCWLPDVFGNSPIMPQILKKGGIDYFVSNKMSTWNDTNRFPYNNFLWKGLDGTTIAACVPPTHFISWAEPDQAIGHWEDFQNKDVCDESLQMYGYGDGGSGVTEEMLELYKRQEKLPYIPKQRLVTGKAYLEEAFADEEKYPVWEGDLYLEMHRGTFTTKGAMKLANRKGEFALGEVEFLNALANISKGEAVVGQEAFKETWKKLLLNQFHDIIPGSHTTAVADEAMALYAEISDEIKAYQDKCQADVLKEESATALTIANTIGLDRAGIARVENEALADRHFMYEGKTYHTQTLAPLMKDDVLSTVFEVPSVPKLSMIQVNLADGLAKEMIENAMSVTVNHMENDYYTLELNGVGEISRLYDKVRQVELLEKGSIANEWQMYDDRPGVYNAWDIVDNYTDYPIDMDGDASIEVVEDGCVSVAVKVTRSFSNSRSCQIIRLYRTSPRIDFETWVDWQEDQKLLKVAFPLSFKGSEYRVDTSAGIMTHPNHGNTTWQKAKFEVPCHKWVEMSSGHVGVAILNDSKYGCDVKDHQIRLSLLRAPIRPDRHSDRGQHRFTYSFFAHDGQWQKSALIETAYNLNWPIKGYVGMGMDVLNEALLKTSNNQVLVQSVKLAEDGSGDVIVRMTEVKQTFGTMSLDVGFDVESAHYCDLLERPYEVADLSEIPFSAYEIMTLRLKRR